MYQNGIYLIDYKGFGAEGGIQKRPFRHLPRHLQLNFKNRVSTSVYAVAKCCHP